jgi:hypothetical protein
MASTVARVGLGGLDLAVTVPLFLLTVEATVELAAVFDTLGDPTAGVTTAEYVGVALFAAAAMTWALATLATAVGWFTAVFSRGLMRGLSLAGIAAATATTAGTLLAGTPPADVVFLALGFGVLATPLAVNLLVVRSAGARSADAESGLFASSDRAGR